jgi:hypothetical protein
MHRCGAAATEIGSSCPYFKPTEKTARTTSCSVVVHKQAFVVNPSNRIPRCGTDAEIQVVGNIYTESDDAFPGFDQCANVVIRLL